MIFPAGTIEKPSRIAIIDYRMSNMFSIKNALDMLGFESEVTSDYKNILSSNGAILPGVGSFHEAMKYINQLELAGPIREFVSTGKPFMGICLGLQLLLSESEEFGYTDGLGIVEGKVENFTKHESVRRVPHIGWNCVKREGKIKKNIGIDPLKEVENGEYFYFVHSCYVNPANKSDVCTYTEYSGLEFCSSVFRDNIFACQFHPEKSGEKGLRILKNFFATGGLKKENGV